MDQPEKRKATLEEFYLLREESDKIYEFFDGLINMSPSPSTKHQRISGRLYAQLFNLLAGSGCEVFHAPFDIVFENEETNKKEVLVPDLSVICDQQGLTESNYQGVPSLIIEILSPSNQSHDLVTKLNKYMKYGVAEYWIINPMLGTIQLYVLDNNGTYLQKDIVKETGKVYSSQFEKFIVDAEKLFQ
ncbi:Uma2 family endonuclease [Scopulibacillus darangshiensis]|uniref:Uma2 family endonuclease n=1 Tax=Scopulibacillus darangshiensis TaxID=442528 RepID=A0A4R2NE38_9BACL|nr:Uma2 family endonuclease [Scopulibacillus darangshiensis]TCP19477.1 Uma2 family endonuclease [Scopulibacillus darangshiensis]